MFRKILLFFAFFAPSYAFSLVESPSVSQDFEFGNFAQLTSNAGAVLSSAGQLSNLSGLLENSGPLPQNVVIGLKFNGSGLGEKFDLDCTSAPALNLSTSSCVITIDNLTCDPLSFSRMQAGAIGMINIGAKLTINGLCTEGDYQGNLSIPYTGCEKANPNKCISGQYSGNITVPVHVHLSTPLSVKSTQDMNLGTVLMPSQSSTITVSPLGSYTSSGNLHFEETDITPGRFEVTGLSNRVVNITLPGSTVLLNENNTSMTVDTFTSNPTGILNLDTTGSGIINVGGTLHLNAGQQSGSYSGTYSIIVSY